jgi:Spy/CpxP family protein refolding chaperone
MKRNVLLLVLVFLFIVNGTALVTLAYHRWIKPAPEYSGQETVDALRETMSLTEGQLLKMKRLREALDSRVEVLRDQIQVKRAELMAALEEADPDLASIDRTIDEIGALQSRIEKQTVRNLLRDKRVLNPAQQSQYLGMFREHVRGRGLGRGQGRGRRARGGRGLGRSRDMN